jgi:hypothetical protein
MESKLVALVTTLGLVLGVGTLATIYLQQVSAQVTGTNGGVGGMGTNGGIGTNGQHGTNANGYSGYSTGDRPSPGGGGDRPSPGGGGGRPSPGGGGGRPMPG